MSLKVLVSLIRLSIILIPSFILTIKILIII